MADEKKSMAISKDNYKIMIVGAIITIIGFFVMAGGGSNDPNVYNPAVYSFARITLAPILILLGYAIVLYGIMKKPKNEKQQQP